ncbi:DUF853 family protein, partial [Candidatus Pacearchaeota archaeon]
MKNSFFALAIALLLLANASAQSQSSAYGEPIIQKSFEISRSKIERTIKEKTIFQDFIKIKNKKTTPLKVTFTISNELSGIITSKETGIQVEPKNESKWYFNVEGLKIGTFSGEISLSGDIEQKIPVNITITNKSLNPVYLVEIQMREKETLLTDRIEFKLNLKKLKPEPLKNFTISYFLKTPKNKTIELGSENFDFTNPIQLIKEFNFPENAEVGYYVLQVKTKSGDEQILTEENFYAKIPLMQRKLFGILPVWLLISIIGFILFGLIAFYLIRKRILSKRKYKMTLDLKAIPKKDKSFLWLGKIAEKNIGAYLDPNRLMTHAIVAGATGGGKSITAQVIIEEALMKNIAVLVFDPTAQWSGMLRKCTDKKMLSFYPKFGMKPTQARGFPGNIRAVKDARQIIRPEKYSQPGHIQIFTLNKLQPKDMDIFVANTIRQIFQSDPKESPTLKTLLVFDEVHRLLSRFGGSGEGFVQIERACREFRKWGYGVMLISQVLSDFVGEIKANISTEIQMRTRDEGDLNRIKTKYGEEFLQSLVKASAGVGMFVNPAHNHANPYFINFRPILHNTRRLPDEELEKYNKYNDIVDDLE